MIEKKKTLEEEALEKSEEIEREHMHAEKNRENAMNEKLAKVQEHLSKVDQRRKSKSILDQSQAESLTESIASKMEAAEQRRLEKLNEKVTIA